MKAVEVSGREGVSARLQHHRCQIKLMRAAFHPENGPLTDMEAEGGERVGPMELGLQIERS